ncbi:MAG: cupredoxin domain-containing protein [Acidimicrobiia bacterium]
MRTIACALGVVALSAVPATEASAARRVPDPIVGFTFAAGTPSLYAPGQPLRIRTGDVVVWTNLDPVGHDVSFDVLDFNPQLGPGESAELAFTRPGHYTYHCHEHHEIPSMHGLVYVSD